MRFQVCRGWVYRGLVWSTVLANVALAGIAHAEEKVVLGDSRVTAGIPGTGSLSEKQAKEWFGNAKHHLPLQVELPAGIAAAAENVFIPSENPMTLAKIELGRQLYFDRRLSMKNEVSCADCHHPNHGYAFETQFGVGVGKQTGNRNSPVAFNRILSKEQFWDGRAGTLEAQAVGPIANPIEMANTHEGAVQFLKGNRVYTYEFDKVFGKAPNIDDVGRAIAAFERTLVTGASPYDDREMLRKIEEAYAEDLEDLPALKEDDPDLYAKYVEAKKMADANPMSEAAIRGRTLFFQEKSNCAACHLGANFTDEKYHNLGVGMDAATPDLGRYEVTKLEADRGAFKTPTLRNIAETGPYMHDGSQKTLEEVVEWYAKGGHPNPQLSEKIKKLDLTAEDKADLVAFMKALTGPFPHVEQGRLPE